ncbi:substrate-binding domain-containing protein [Aggregatilinea lenta]|uniref:substrate-binding domain-containing protein n=1 Tax=Aggregatilinea lenta TaxID=913108 RepID=UPI000E5BF123|nr:substrate-binding domain-containing protein [Aggregatilinea lenta]
MKTLIRLITLVTLVAVLAGLPIARNAAAQDDPLKITFIVYADASVEFFVPVVQGAEDAAELFGVDLDVQYGNSDPVQQNDLIESAIVNEVDGIAVSIQDNDAFDEVVCKAIDAGIAVVSFNVDDAEGAAGNCRMAFMGQNFVDTGYLIASHMIEEHGLKEGDHVFVPVEAPEAVYAQLRFEGVKKALDEAGITSELVGTGFNLADAQTTEAQYLLGHPETDAIIGLGSVNLSVAPMAVQEAGMDIPMGGYDLTDDIIAGIEDGVITATVDQQPYSQGFYAVTQLVLYLEYGLYPSDMDTGGLGLVDASNVATVKELVGTIR